jgi:hypothetical protein
MVLLKITMGVPVLVIVCPARVNLNEAHSTFHQSPRQQAFLAEILGSIVVNTVHVLDVFGLTVHVNSFGSSGLHLVCQFVTGNAGGQIAVVNAVRQMPLIEMFEMLQQDLLFAGIHVAGILQIQNGCTLWTKHRALIRGGHVTAGPVFRTTDRSAGLIQHDHITG